ncbi:MAG TPA: TIR domain-containing protein [Anaerolineales bacterium]|nr:TIR domain-containing protein [Anaerolineales bacterium]
MNVEPAPKSIYEQEPVNQPADQTEDFIVTGEESINETIPPEAFSEDERIHILAEITDMATHARSDHELYEGCLQKIFAAIPRVERATILVDLGGELFPIKHFPREQAYYSETYAAQAKHKRKAFSWLRKHAESEIPESMFDVVAAMYTPMVRNGKVVGVLHVDSTSLIEGFSRSELDMLNVIASILALALSSKSPTDEPTIPSVFISYSHEDAQFANKLKGDLRRNGISVWIDERLKPAEETWLDQLTIAIREQRYFLFLMSERSISSEYCQWELNMAQSFERNIIPILLEKIDLPPSLAPLQYIDFSSDARKGLDLLTETIHSKNQYKR